MLSTVYLQKTNHINLGLPKPTAGEGTNFELLRILKIKLYEILSLPLPQPWHKGRGQTIILKLILVDRKKLQDCLCVIGFMSLDDYTPILLCLTLI